MMIRSLFLSIVLCITTLFQVQAATITDMRFSSAQTDSARIVLEMTEREDVSVLMLHNPERVALDIPSATLSQTVRTKKVPSGNLISTVRFGTPKSGITRIVLDLKKAVSESHFILPPSSDKGIWRFVMDLKSASSSKMEPLAPVKTTAQTKTQTTAKPTQATQPKQTATNPNPGLRPFTSKQKAKKIIMLDPGHGGQDPGAIAKNGHYEKDLTLKMARETRKIFEDAGYKVVMTRNSDVFVTLRGRVQKAHEAKADLFVSIHADSAPNTSARGLSIYTLSEKASDKEAAALAERENKADIIFGMDLGDYQPEVSNVLIDLAKRDTMTHSVRYAGFVVKEMKKTVKLVPNAHRFAGFAVLKSANIPSVLLEMGYLSHKQEEAEMQKPAYRKKLAQALLKAVNQYFSEMDD